MRHQPIDGPPIAYHVALRPEDQRVIVPDAARRRVAARVVMAQGEHRGLVYFAVVDTHVHATVATHRDAAGRFAHDVETSLRWRLGLVSRFEPASIRPVRTQWHLTTGLWYTLDQDRRHGVHRDRAHDGTGLLDVLGGRVMLATDGPGRARRLCPALGVRLASMLPRVRGRELLTRVGGLEMLATEPRIEDLEEAVAAAVGLGDLQDRGAIQSIARRAAAHVASSCRTTDVAAALGVTPRAVQRFRASPADPIVARAVAIQWHLRTYLRRQRERAASPSFDLPLLVEPSGTIASSREDVAAIGP